MSSDSLNEQDAATTFADLGLSDKVVSAVADAGYTVPTPIQAGAIPHALAGKDVLGIAQTGTGKTASFVLPMLTRLERGRARARMPRTLILEPTRELAAQVEENFVKYGKNHRLNISLLIGGMSFDEQDQKLQRGADVLIATPGRLLDHFERGKLLLTGVELLVIDEADRMLDMGFIPDIEKICKLIPFTRQTLFFSATMPPEITKLTEQFLHAPVRIEVAKASSTATTVEQKLVKSGAKAWDKRAVLRDLINAEGDAIKNAIIFCNRKVDVSELFRSLTRHEFSAGALHGDMDQRARMTMLSNFRDGKLKLLVASDVAARGLDIPDVSHVFNYDIPIHAEDYVHRIGRTGRAGRSGKAFTIITKNDKKYLDAVQTLIGNEIAWLDGDLTTLPAVTEEDDTPRKGRGAKGAKKPARERGRGPRKADHIDAGTASVEQAEQPVVAIIEDAPKQPQPARTEKPERAPRPERQNDNNRQPDNRQQENRQPDNRRPAREENRDQPRDPRDNNRRGGRNRRDDDDFDQVVGFGDDVPAFMLIKTAI